MKKQTPALTMIKECVSITHRATYLHVSKRAISDPKQAPTGLPDNAVPTKKKREQGRRRGPLMELMQYGIEM